MAYKIFVVTGKYHYVVVDSGQRRFDVMLIADYPHHDAHPFTKTPEFPAMVISTICKPFI